MTARNRIGGIRVLLVSFLLFASNVEAFSENLNSGFTVSKRILPSKVLKESNLKNAPLFPVSIVSDRVSEQPQVPSRDVIKKHTGEYGSICYVVRRPGWNFCREEGQALTKLSTASELEGFNFFGVIKETRIDDKGLMEFGDYYPFPLYRDGDLKFYKALGNQKIRLSWNPIRFVKGIFRIFKAIKRIRRKKIKGNLTGEGMKKGGVIIFGSDGIQKYAYTEEPLTEIPVNDILATAVSMISDNNYSI